MRLHRCPVLFQNVLIFTQPGIHIEANQFFCGHGEPAQLLGPPGIHFLVAFVIVLEMNTNLLVSVDFNFLNQGIQKLAR